MTMRQFASIQLVIFCLTAIFHANFWPYIMVTIAQLVFIPLTLHLVKQSDRLSYRWLLFFAIFASIAIAVLNIYPSAVDTIFAAIYFAFTIAAGGIGLFRFLHRGFRNLEEFSIDLGLMYLAIGGGWFYAYVSGIDTGFSPLLTWLTAIHFHYSSFLLPIFIGFLGRIHRSTLYKWTCLLLLTAPIFVALGIAFSRWLELFSVALYMIGISFVIFIAYTTPFINRLQRLLVRLSFTALAITITFSLFYILSNGFGIMSTSIDFMLRFHGVLNCLLFALVGLCGWTIHTPPPRQVSTFPISTFRKLLRIEQYEWTTKATGLVDLMEVYETTDQKLSPVIRDFYESTAQYQLQAVIQWKVWFYPFAAIYKLLSRATQQINLPLTRKRVTMTGELLTPLEPLDNREKTRVWLRKINKDTAFIALYSSHQNNGKTYMNIALPLPFSTMIGVLELQPTKQGLFLSSKGTTTSHSDAGIYLSFKENHIFKLPLAEDFFVKEISQTELSATHTMRIFSIPFLQIKYDIQKGSS